MAGDREQLSKVGRRLKKKKRKWKDVSNCLKGQPEEEKNGKLDMDQNII